MGQTCGVHEDILIDIRNYPHKCYAHGEIYAKPMDGRGYCIYPYLSLFFTLQLI